MLVCWAAAYPTLSASVLQTLRPDIADRLLYNPPPVTDFGDKFFSALAVEILYIWNDPKQTTYALKLVELLGEHAGSKHIRNLTRLLSACPKNDHQQQIQQALIAVLPNWKARE